MKLWLYVTPSKMWAIMQQQVDVSVAITTVWVICIVFIAVGLAFALQGACKKEGDYYDGRLWKGLQIGIRVVMFCILLLEVKLVNNIVGKVSNPDFYALKLLIETMEGF